VPQAEVPVVAPAVRPVEVPAARVEPVEPMIQFVPQAEVPVVEAGGSTEMIIQYAPAAETPADVPTRPPGRHRRRGDTEEGW